MSTPLHDLDVLHSLAEGPAGPGRDWANLGLAIRAPSTVHCLPEDAYDAALCMAAGAPASHREVLAGLQGAQTTARTGILAEQLSAFGLAPTGNESWAQPLREAIQGKGEVQDLYLAQLLTDIGFLDGDSLAAASKVDHDDAQLALPALVVRFATPRGAGADAAAAVVAELAAGPHKDNPYLAANVLALVGIPHLQLTGRDDLDLARQAAALGGGDVPKVSAKGSARRRGQKWVRELLAGIDEAGAHLLRAMADRELGPPKVWIAAASWLAARPAGLAPLDAVLDHNAGEDRALLASARLAIGADDKERVLAQIDRAELELCPASLFAADLTEELGTAQEWLDSLLARFKRQPGVDFRSDLVTTLVFGRSPDMVATLLNDRSTRDTGLMFARLAPTEEVLEALLEMPVPGDERPRELYAQALAEMGTPAVTAPLAALRAHGKNDEVLAACQRAEGILQRPLS